MFRLAWFLGGYGLQGWTTPWSGDAVNEWSSPDIYLDLVRSLERARFDMLFIEDSAMVEDSYGGSMETTMKYGMFVPKNDPMPLLPLLTQATKSIGVVATISTLQYHPYLAARLGTTLDHLSGGRAGLNVVTSVTHRVAQNFGLDQHFEHDQRYAMAEEWLDAVSALWETWDEDALVLDPTSPHYADHTKVHPADFVGEHYRTRGPLNTIPGPQRRPMIAQAGNSGPGRDMAARHSDMMLALAKTPQAMRELREDMNRRLVSFGRRPEDLKIFFMTSLFQGATDEEAFGRRDAFEGYKKTQAWIDQKLWLMSYASGGVVDYSTFDLDGPMPQIVGNGEQSTTKQLLDGSATKTLREVVEGPANYGIEFTGSNSLIADQMEATFTEAGLEGDGFLINAELTRRSIAEVTDGLAYELRRRGLIRDRYSHATFRDNLRSF